MKVISEGKYVEEEEENEKKEKEYINISYRINKETNKPLSQSIWQCVIYIIDKQLID